MKTTRFAIAACSLMLSTFAQAQNSSLSTNPVYEKNCAKCHGKTAEGRFMAGPSLASEKVGAASADDLRAMITNGKGRMPKFAGKLTAEEIDALVQQIKALPKK